MELAKVQVTGLHVRVIRHDHIPKNIIGATVSITYSDPMWESLTKTVVFEGSGVTKDIPNAGETVTIPPEVVAVVGSEVKIGVYGVSTDGITAGIPTLWAVLGFVRAATDPSGDESTDPTLPVWAQMQADIAELQEQSGGADPEKIKNAVEEYLEENPPEIKESDPTVPGWAKQPEKPSYNAQEVGADPAGTAEDIVSQHNTDTAAHNDLRVELKALADRINAVLDSDDETLDELSEIVAYIKSNKTLIDAITTSKVSVTDIADDLVTNLTDKPLSAAQGVVLKGLIDSLRNEKLDASKLTEAIDTALAQAKESGEFDGDDYVLTPADKAEIAEMAAELVDVPEGSGGGISVTGAAVGQTVKIAAVDENGVPTAWEPVDFSNGGSNEVWELIGRETVTTEDSASRVAIDADCSKYKKVRVKAELRTDGTTEKNIGINEWYSSNGTICNRLTSKVNCYDVIFQKDPTTGYVYSEGFASSSTWEQFSVDGGLLNNYFRMKNKGNNPSGPDFSQGLDNIKSIWIWVYNDIFLTGTWLEIWGCK